MKDILYLLCLEYKVCSIPYFLDEMQYYELDLLTENLQLAYRQEWEQTRYLCYVTAQTQSTKRLKPTDIMKFKWDKETMTTGDTSITTEDINRLREKAKQIQQTMKI